MSTGTVYLLHFDRPIGNATNPHGQAQHYIGWAADLDARLHDHETGRGARITAAVVALGLAWVVARTWAGDRRLERQLKDRKRAAALCPVCRAAKRAGGAL